MKYLKNKKVCEPCVVKGAKGSLGTVDVVAKKTVKGKTSKATPKSVLKNLM